MLLTILVGDGTLTVSETALSPYWESTDKLAGTYTKTGEDPYAIPLDETYGGASSSLPDSIRDTVIDGKSVSVYLDPQGRFSAVFPSLFYAAPAGQQPEDGVYLVGDAENAKLTVEAQPLGSAVTAGDYMEYLRQQFVSCSVEQQEDGLIRLTRTFFDDNTTEWEEIALFHLAGEEIYKIDFVFIAADAASYEPMAENMYFIFN